MNGVGPVVSLSGLGMLKHRLLGVIIRVPDLGGLERASKCDFLTGS